MGGPLSGVRVVELAGIGPIPFAGMMLSDLGADVLRIDRVADVVAGGRLFTGDQAGRGRRSVGVDLKHPSGVDVVLRLVEAADALIEGFRPGVAERLGVGPDPCLARNPRLVYGRMTGWGQNGPLSGAAGHDIDYIALTGALDAIGRCGQPPTPPLNLLGDYGGGAVFLAFGVVCALFEAQRSGEGQVVDAAIVDGVSLLLTSFFGMRERQGPRGTGVLDSGAPFYDAYETSDGRFIAIGAMEPQFWSELLSRIDVDAGSLPDQWDQSSWPATKERLAAVFRSRTRDEWCAVLEGSDACFAPVLSMAEAEAHPHMAQRSVHVDAHGTVQPAPAPRFSRTPGEIAGPVPKPGEHSVSGLVDWGFTLDEVERLVAEGAVAARPAI